MLSYWFQFRLGQCTIAAAPVGIRAPNHGTGGMWHIHFWHFQCFLTCESAAHALGRLLTEIVSRSGDISVLDWVGESSFQLFPTPYCFVPSYTLFTASSQCQVLGNCVAVE